MVMGAPYKWPGTVFLEVDSHQIARAARPSLLWCRKSKKSLQDGQARERNVDIVRALMPLLVGIARARSRRMQPSATTSGNPEGPTPSADIPATEHI